MRELDLVMQNSVAISNKPVMLCREKYEFWTCHISQGGGGENPLFFHPMVQNKKIFTHRMKLGFDISTMSTDLLGIYGAGGGEPKEYMNFRGTMKFCLSSDCDKCI